MNRLLIPIIFITVFISFFRLGSFTLFDVDEAVFSVAAKEMVENGDWITPTYNGDNFYDKPVLFYWLMAVSYKIFGINEFGARFPSALASILLIIAIFFFTKYVQDDKNAFLSSIVSVLCIYFFVYSHAAVMDMTLTLFISLSLFSFYLWIHGNEESPAKNKMYGYGFYSFSALALLTKGLIGFIFPFGIAAAYMIITDGWNGFKRIFTFKGIILFMIISLPWYITQITINGQEFFDQFFMKHHFKRYTGVISGHKGPIYYYIPVLLIGLFPWIAFLPAGIKNALKQKDRLKIFYLTWFTFILLFFSFSTTKLPNYILPALPAISLLIASGMTVQDKKWQHVSYILLAILSLIFSIFFIIVRRYAINAGLSDLKWLIVLSMITTAIAIMCIYTIFTKRQLFTYISSLMIVFFSILIIKALPIANQYLQGSLHKYSLYAKDKLNMHNQLIVYRLNNPSIIFYSDRKASIVRNKDDLKRILKDDRHEIVITKTKNVEYFENMGLNLLEKDEKYALLERK